MHQKSNENLPFWFYLLEITYETEINQQTTNLVQIMVILQLQPLTTASGIATVYVVRVESVKFQIPIRSPGPELILW